MITAIEGIFRGAKVVAVNRPLFCPSCDKFLSTEYQKAFDAGAPVRDLVGILSRRRGKTVHRELPDGRTDWACSCCGRAAKNLVGKRGDGRHDRAGIDI